MKVKEKISLPKSTDTKAKFTKVLSCQEANGEIEIA